MLSLREMYEIGNPKRSVVISEFVCVTLRRYLDCIFNYAFPSANERRACGR